MQRKRVGIIVYEEVEVLDFCGPFEVFSVTRLNEEKRRDEPSQCIDSAAAAIRSISRVATRSGPTGRSMRLT